MVETVQNSFPVVCNLFPSRELFFNIQSDEGINNPAFDHVSETNHAQQDWSETSSENNKEDPKKSRDNYGVAGSRESYGLAMSRDSYGVAGTRDSYGVTDSLPRPIKRNEKTYVSK